MSQMVRESKPEVPWHRLSVEIGTGEVVFLTELIVVYLDNSSCWSKVTASLIPHITRSSLWTHSLGYH